MYRNLLKKRPQKTTFKSSILIKKLEYYKSAIALDKTKLFEKIKFSIYYKKNISKKLLS